MVSPNLRLLICSVIILTLAAATGVMAQIAPTLNYQGRLTDASGTPVVDGNYDLIFRIYTAPSGGSLQWNSGASPVSVPVVNGLFSVVLGDASMTALPEPIFSGQTLYLEIEISGEAPFTPRQPIVATAYSLRANFAEESQNAQFLGGLSNSAFVPITGGTMTGLLTINIGGGGDEFIFSRSSTSGYSSFLQYFAGAPRILMFGLQSGGQITVVDDNDEAQINLAADPIFGGTLRLNDNEGGNGIFMLGGSSSTQTVFELTAGGNASLRIDASDSSPQPKLTIADEVGIPQIELDPGNANPGSKVYLPAGSIDGYEIADNTITGDKLLSNAISVSVLNDDAGGAQNAFQSATSLFLTSAGQATIIQAAINAPADGFVLAIASFNLKVYHVSATKSEAIFGLTADPPNLPGDQTREYIIWPSITSGTFGELISLQRIFPVTAGVNQITLTGEKTSGVNDHQVTDATLSLLYFKSSYGVVN